MNRTIRWRKKEKEKKVIRWVKWKHSGSQLRTVHLVINETSPHQGAALTDWCQQPCCRQEAQSYTVGRTWHACRERTLVKAGRCGWWPVLCRLHRSRSGGARPDVVPQWHWCWAQRPSASDRVPSSGPARTPRSRYGGHLWVTHENCTCHASLHRVRVCINSLWTRPLPAALPGLPHIYLSIDNESSHRGLEWFKLTPVTVKITFLWWIVSWVLFVC